VTEFLPENGIQISHHDVHRCLLLHLLLSEQMTSMNLQTLPLWKRMAAGYLIVGMLVVTCGAAGGAGIFWLGRLLTQLSGPAWTTADGAMNAAIHIQAQIIASCEMIHGVDAARNQQRLETHQESTVRELQRVKDAGVLSSEQLAPVNESLQKYNTSLSRLLEHHHNFEASKRDFKTQAETFIAISEALEKIGDAQVDELAADPEKLVTWSGAISARWDAADGGMESGIGFLTQLFYLEQLTAGHDAQHCRKEIEAARVFHKEAMNLMLATGTFDKPFAEGEIGGASAGQKMSDVCLREFATVCEKMDHYIASFLKMQDAKETYNSVAEATVAAVARIEDEADKSVTDIIATVAWARFIAALAILVPLLATIAVGVFVGLKGTKALAAPIEASVGILRSTTGAAASAITQMTYSISSIARSTERAAAVSRGASEVADRGRTSIASLGHAADQINGVVALIESIAGKTNLLALNATIEAARAGESGKGFAVVANEVKALARQTGDATREIRTRLDEMRQATDATVNDIGQIFHVISEVDAVNQEIARAAEEQSLATGDISRCVEATTNAAETVNNIVSGTSRAIAV